MSGKVGFYKVSTLPTGNSVEKDSFYLLSDNDKAILYISDNSGILKKVVNTSEVNSLISDFMASFTVDSVDVNGLATELSNLQTQIDTKASAASVPSSGTYSPTMVFSEDLTITSSNFHYEKIGDLVKVHGRIFYNHSEIPVNGEEVSIPLPPSLIRPSSVFTPITGRGVILSNNLVTGGTVRVESAPTVSNISLTIKEDSLETGTFVDFTAICTIT